MKRVLAIFFAALSAAISLSAQISMRQFMKDAVVGKPFAGWER